MVGQSWPLMLCLIELEHLISGYFINDGNEKISKGKEVTNIGDEPQIEKWQSLWDTIERHFLLSIWRTFKDFYIWMTSVNQQSF